MGFSPTMTGNIGTGTYTFRGPVSASSWNISSNLNNGTINIGQNASQNAQGLTSGLTMQTNIIPGTVTIIANQASFTGSSTIFANNMVVGGANLTLNQSAATLTNNIINDSGFALTSNYFSSSAGLGSIGFNRNNIIGASNALVITGSQPAGTTNATAYNENFMGGGSNTIFVNVSTARVSATTAYHSALRNIIYGTNLIVTGSSASGDTTSYGSAFFGRYNANDAIRNKTSDVVFAVGTGTSTSNRKTGFLIDSGSNTFIEGTLNVNSSLTISGSLTVSGSTTLQGNTTFIDRSGTNNNSVYLGSTALSSNTTGLSNVAIGQSTLQNNTTGNNNFALGVNALASNTTGNNSFAAGADAGRFASGSSNIFIGGGSGQYVTGSANTIIGAYTGTAGEVLDSNIILADGNGNARAQYSGSAWSLQGEIKLTDGGPIGVTTLSFDGSAQATLSNSLINSSSVILITCIGGASGQTIFLAQAPSTGSVLLQSNYASTSQTFNYLIINPI
jgi:hypothetical protein